MRYCYSKLLIGWVASTGLLLAIPLRAQPLDVAEISKRAEALTQGSDVPALGLVITKQGKPVLLQAWGTTQVGAGQPVTTHTVFRLASVSKGFTSAAAGIAVEKQYLRWNSPAVQWTPHARLATQEATTQLTLAAILSQQSGVRPYHYGDRSLQAGKSKKELDKLMAGAPMKCAPGHCYSYQNVIYQWAGDMVGAAVHRPFTAFMAQQLFKPLNMKDASTGIQGLIKSPSWARPHIRSGSGVKTVDPKPNYYLLPAAAGVNASPQDLAEWLAAQGGYRPKVLSRSLLDILHTPRTEVPPFTYGWRKAKIRQQWYAMGWRVWDYQGTQIIMHAGAVQGYRSLVILIPSREAGIAMVWNSESSRPGNLTPDLIDALIKNR